MNRIDKKINDSLGKGKKILSPYITAGDPNPKLTVPLMHELVDKGADILEIGIPFSDPMAEGIVIQKAMERALEYNVNTDHVFEMVSEFRKEDNETPIILMGYLNPVEQYGYRDFAIKAVQSGVDGTILVDLPPEESEEINKVWMEEGLYSIYLCSPTTSDSRMKLINKYGRGYLYYVSLKGVTGSDSLNIEQVKNDYHNKRQQTDLPLFVGFGIKTPDMASSVACFADGVIVGAALISNIMSAYEENDNQALKGVILIEQMRQSIDSNGK